MKRKIILAFVILCTILLCAAPVFAEVKDNPIDRFFDKAVSESRDNGELIENSRKYAEAWRKELHNAATLFLKDYNEAEYPGSNEAIAKYLKQTDELALAMAKIDVLPWSNGTMAFSAAGFAKMRVYRFAALELIDHVNETATSPRYKYIFSAGQ